MMTMLLTTWLVDDRHDAAVTSQHHYALAAAAAAAVDRRHAIAETDGERQRETEMCVGEREQSNSWTDRQTDRGQRVCRGYHQHIVIYCTVYSVLPLYCIFTALHRR